MPNFLQQFDLARDWAINPIALACALIAAGGMFIVAASLGLFAGRVSQVRTGKGVSLATEQARINGNIGTQDGTLFERLLAPMTRSLQEHSSVTERDWVERAYDLLDRKKGSADYYLKKVLLSMAGFAAGIALGVTIVTTGGSLLAMLILPLTFSALLYQLPKWELQADLVKRREQMMFEMPYLLDKLSINILAKSNLIQGLEETVARPEGGYLMRELLQVVEDNATSNNVQAALRRMAERNADVPTVVRVALRLAMAEETGASVVKALQSAGDRAVDAVENMIQSRGEQNNMLMVAPSMIALIGVLIAMAGPAISPMLSLLK